ncbi:(Fe-S)-binding protein [Neobacillus kokaensis]|uniref:Glycolate oxidase iron-sulfur subunit n=1 Tax=Neobacillus kokaensis TaxID=2759023 RepID=A0ABQ3N2K5_9BACI|nr:(Fe-S)-binding protein [Neobacillus kokaensis]GHH98829.1 glycolate oxidase iron-sulfur subunit [Neobacillus kokaensis]
MDKQTILLDKLAYNETVNCVQCGYCLPSCPTYATFGKETHSPRGRINLVKMAAEGRISLDDLAGPMDVCLGCRACEPACPTNVQYGKILESAIDVLTEQRRRKQSLKEKAMKKLIFDYMIPNKNVLHFIGSGLQLYQTLKIDDFSRKIGFTNILPEPMRQFEKITPKVNVKKRKHSAIQPDTSPRFRIGFFVGCIMDTFFKRINDLSMKLLAAAGCEVVLIAEQTCCGALHHHSGEKEKAISLAKHNIEAFEKYQFDYVVNSIGGCGAAMVEYHLLFDEADRWYPRAELFSDKCKDISFILDQLELPFKMEIQKTVTYQPSCHLKNVQKVEKEPVRLIEKIPGISYIPHKNMNMCCGSAGIYNIVHFEESMEILNLKMENISKIKPEIIITTNPGCHLQMLLGVEREGLRDEIRAVHLVELLAEACDIS